MSWGFRQVVRGSSTNTGAAVIRKTSRKPDTSLLLPKDIDLTTEEGMRAMNERFDQIERSLRSEDEYEVSLAIKAGYGSLDAVPTTLTPVTGAKVTLDKLGTWLILASFDWDIATPSGIATGVVVIDPETESTAKKQDAVCRATVAGTSTAWCLFTATTVPRLVQLYASATAGTWALLEGGTSVCAVWIGQWEAGDKRFGRQIESTFTAATDMNGQTITDHGEEARYPESDHPDYISHGVELPSL